MSATYAGAKSKAAAPSLNPLNQKAAQAELSDAQKAVIAERARLVKKHIPEAMAFIKALHAEGLVDGLRCIASVTVFEEVNHGTG